MEADGARNEARGFCRWAGPIPQVCLFLHLKDVLEGLHPALYVLFGLMVRAFKIGVERKAGVVAAQIITGFQNGWLYAAMLAAPEPLPGPTGMPCVLA